MLESYIEETQTLLSDLELFFSAGEKLETTLDNVGVSLPFNFKLFGFGAPVLWALGPAVALIIVYVPIHVFLERRYRDSWSAYFERERDRLDRISVCLNDIAKVAGENLENLTLTDETKNSLKQLVASLESYEYDTTQLENTKKLHAEYWLELKYSNDQDNQKKWLERMLGSHFYAFYEKLKNKLNAEELNKEPRNILQAAKAVGAEQLAHVAIPPHLANEKNRLEEAQKNEDMQFINGTLFNGVLAYGLAYWLVYYFTIEILKPTAFAPLTWGLLALSFPAIYLMYKEFVSYKKRVLEKDKKPGSQQDLSFRFGWVLIALIISVSLGNILSFGGFGTLSMLFIASLVFAGFLAVVFVALKMVDALVNVSSLESLTEEASVHQKIDIPIRNRKQHAEVRRKLLDESALAAYQLSLQCKLQVTRKDSGMEKIVSETNLSLTSDAIDAIYADTEGVENFSITATARRRSMAETTRLILNTTLSVLLGYALGALLAFVLGDFMGHFTTVFSGTLLNVVGGFCGLGVGALFGRRAYLSEKVHQNQLDILWAQSQTQQTALKTLEDTILQLNYLVIDMEKLQRALIKKLEGSFLSNGNEKEASQLIATLKKVKFDTFSHPVKREGITLRKTLFVIRAILQTIVAIATVLLMARGLLTMGFAKIIPWFNGSLSLFGASISPLALIILGFALTLLILKAVNDVYLAGQRQEESYQLDRMDFDISLKEAEKSYLENRADFLKQTNAELPKYFEKPNRNTHILSEKVSDKETEDEDEQPEKIYNLNQNQNHV
jgi:hypothetical protein